MKKYNILRCGDQDFWAYYNIAQEHKKYSNHNISYAKHDKIKLDNIDLIYIHSPDISPYHANILPLEARNKGIKVIGAYAGEPNFWSKHESRFYVNADLIVTISPQTYYYAKTYCEKWQVPIVFLPESVDTEFFQPDFNKINNPSKEKFVVGWAGGEHKQVKRAYLLDKLNYKVIKKSDWQKLRQTQKADLGSMLDFYHSIDCLVVTSITECQPRTVMEAMACGIPIISTDVGSMRMLIDSKWIVPVNPEELVIKGLNHCLKELKNNPSLRKEVGLRNLEHIKKYWSWKNNTILWDTVIEAVMRNDINKVMEISNNFLKPFTTDFDNAFKGYFLNKEKKSHFLETLFSTIEKIKSVLSYLNKLNIKYWLTQTSCLDCVRYGESKIHKNKLFIGTDTIQNQRTILKELKGCQFNINGNKAIKGGIVIIVEINHNIKKTIRRILYNIPVLVPLFTVKYLRELYGENWLDKC